MMWSFILQLSEYHKSLIRMDKAFVFLGEKNQAII